MTKLVLITRPEQDAATTANALVAQNYQVICQPFLKIVMDERVIENIENYQGIIFTSQNAVRAFCLRHTARDMDVYAVGQATKELSYSYGFKNVHNADGTVDDLKTILSEDQALLYIRGAHISTPITGHNITEEILYHAENIEEIDKSIIEKLREKEVSEVLFYSKRTADNFVQLIRQNALEGCLNHTKALCLGDSMIKSVSVLPWQFVACAQRPTQDSLLALLDTKS